MESILIDLHNHFIENNKISIQKSIDYFLDRFKFNGKKIFALTEHYEKIKNINTYINNVNRIKNDEEIKKHDIHVVFGIELSICFKSNQNKHIVLIFSSNEICKKFHNEIKNSLKKSDDENISFESFNKIIKNFENNYILIPHFGNKYNSFSLDELKEFYSNMSIKSFVVESSNQYNDWFYSKENLKNKFNGEKFHVIVASDRLKNPKLASFIYCDNFNNEKPFNSLKKFFSQNDFFSHLSSNSNCIYEIEFPKSSAKLQFKSNENKLILENMLIYGERGSGKSYIAEDIYSILKDESCYIKQFAFPSCDDKDIVNDCPNIIDEIKTKVDDLKKLIIDKLKKIKLLNDNDNNFKFNYEQKCDLLVESIKENLKNPEKLKLYLKKYDFKIEEDKFSELEKKFEIVVKLHKGLNSIKNILNNENNKWIFSDIIKSKEFSSIINNTTIDENIFNFKFKIAKEMFFINKSINIVEELKKKVKNMEGINFTFEKINLFESYKTMCIIELIKSIMKKSMKIDTIENYACLYKCKTNNEFKLNNISLDTNSLKLVSKNDININASGGQKKEFFILNKIDMDIDKNEKIKYLIFDEVDQSFDSKSIVSFAKKIKKLLNENSWKLILITHNSILWSELLSEGINFTYLRTYNDNDKYYSEQFLELDKDKIFSNFEFSDESYKFRGDKYGYENKSKK